MTPDFSTRKLKMDIVGVGEVNDFVRVCDVVYGLE
jgi:hypothetical protein